MFKQHFTKANLMELPSCYLDMQGNFLIAGTESRPHNEIGVHVTLADDVLCAHYGFERGSKEESDWYLKSEDSYALDHVEKLGYIKFSHWGNSHDGLFCLSANCRPTFAQKLAMKEYCRVNEVMWHRVVS